MDRRSARGGPAESTGDHDSQDRTTGAPKLPTPPPRHAQDTHPVEGEAAIHPPSEEELLKRPRVQG